MNSIGAELLRGKEGKPDLPRRRQLYPCFSRTCQVRCDYCVANMSRPGAHNRPSLLASIGVADYVERLDPILSRWGPFDVFLGGPGEPLIDPDFRELAAAFLARGQWVHVTTNGVDIESLMSLLSMQDAREHGRVSVDVTYQVGPLASRPRVLAMCKENLSALGRAGVLKSVIVPLSPLALARRNEIALDLLWLLRVAPFTGIRLRRLSHNDGEREYPESYTRDELSAIAFLREKVPGSVMDPAGRVWLLPELGERLRLRGAPCYAPSVILNVGLDGGLWNCYAQPFRPRDLGHLVDGYQLERLFSPSFVSCSYDECSCRVLGIRYSLEAHGVSLEDYCLHVRRARDAR